MIIDLGQKSAKTFADRANQSELVKFATLRNDLLELPVCERCERVALHDKGGTYTCPVCGHSGATKTRVRDYLVDEKYIDEAHRERVVFTDLKR